MEKQSLFKRFWNINISWYAVNMFYVLILMYGFALILEDIRFYDSIRDANLTIGTHYFNITVNHTLDNKGQFNFTISYPQTYQQKYVISPPNTKKRLYVIQIFLIYVAFWNIYMIIKTIKNAIK